MSHQPLKAGTARLSLLIKGAYWGALLIIAAMAVASFLFLQQMLAAQQYDQSLLALTATQKALSQRVVFLANAASAAGSTEQPALVDRLKEATAAFEVNYDRMLSATGADPMAPDRDDPDSINAILFSGPHHLDYFSTTLAAGGWRLAAVLHSTLRLIGPSVDDDLAGEGRAHLDETVASATLGGYTALEERIGAAAEHRIDRLVKLHRLLFYATISIIVLVVLFIFSPLSDVILRRTLELVEARNSMAFIAVHDGLTGLHNRTFLTDNFDALLKGARRRNERMAVVQIDLDRFKQINDTLGHPAGDYVLVVTAERIRESCRASDLCARLGGDEFMIVLNGPGTNGDVDVLARRIVERINQPIAFQGTTIDPTASAGVAVFPGDADTVGNLVVHADLALYAAKKQGGGAITYFSEDLRRDLETRKQIEADLRDAIATDAFAVYFQPQVSLASSAITGVEALMRWKHPDRGVVSPGEFIPIAEKCGMMASIGRIVMRKAIAEAAEWHRAGLSFGRLAVNVSGMELREPDFRTFLFETLEREKLPPHKLSLEIVESVILDDEKTGIAAKLRDIRSSGIHLELDDFGTGYASLSHVNPNEIDKLKIDRRFVQNINANGDNTKIVRAITELARGLGIAIVAEGAETEAELDMLRQIGCDQVQGYSIAFPMPDTVARAWMMTRGAGRPPFGLIAGAGA